MHALVAAIVPLATRLRQPHASELLHPTTRLRPLARAYLASGGSRTCAAAFLTHTSTQSRRLGRTVAQRIADRREADFRTGNTMILGGWIVAEAEVLFVTGLDIAQVPSR